MNPLFVVL